MEEIVEERTVAETLMDKIVQRLDEASIDHEKPGKGRYGGLSIAVHSGTLAISVGNDGSVEILKPFGGKSINYKNLNKANMEKLIGHVQAEIDLNGERAVKQKRQQELNHQARAEVDALCALYPDLDNSGFDLGCSVNVKDNDFKIELRTTYSKSPVFTRAQMEKLLPKLLNLLAEARNDESTEVSEKTSKVVTVTSSLPASIEFKLLGKDIPFAEVIAEVGDSRVPRLTVRTIREVKEYYGEVVREAPAVVITSTARTAKR